MALGILVRMGHDIGMSPAWCKAITQTNADNLSTGPLGQIQWNLNQNT